MKRETPGVDVGEIIVCPHGAQSGIDYDHEHKRERSQRQSKRN
jgi:hypothetical protein